MLHCLGKHRKFMVSASFGLREYMRPSVSLRLDERLPDRLLTFKHSLVKLEGCCIRMWKFASVEGSSVVSMKLRDELGVVKDERVALAVQDRSNFVRLISVENSRCDMRINCKRSIDGERVDFSSPVVMWPYAQLATSVLA